MDDRCIHEMLRGTCASCDPRPLKRTHAGFVQIPPSKLFHDPDCAEVTWDPAEAAKPGVRLTLAREEVIARLADGTLERGGECCGVTIYS